MKTKELTCAYFGRPFSVSETFIKELLWGLNKEIYLVFINGFSHSANYEGIKEITSGFKSNSVLTRISWINFFINKINKSLILNINKKRRFNILKGKLADTHIDVAYTDYGINAVQIIDFLKYKGIPLVVHFHGYDITSQLRDETYRKKLLEVFDYSKYVIAASHHIKRLLILEGCSPQKIRVIRYGISIPDNIKPIPWNQKKNKSPNLVFVGRLTQKKNPKALLYAFNIVLKIIPYVNLQIIGDGPLMIECLNLVSSLNIGANVKFHGALEHSKTIEILNNAWIYVQHSVTGLDGDQEGFAISPAEAAFLGIPVVSTLHNGIPEHVIDGETGFLVREYDFETMAEKIIELLNDEEKLENFGLSGRRNIMNLCNKTNRIESIKSLLEK